MQSLTQTVHTNRENTKREGEYQERPKKDSGIPYAYHTRLKTHHHQSSTSIFRLGLPTTALFFLLAAISLCLTLFFAANSEPALLLAAALTPANDLLDAPAPILERTLPLPEGRPGVDPAKTLLAADLCAPSWAMTREREMRGLRATRA